MKYSKIKNGEVFSESQHYVATKITPTHLTLKPDSGDEIEVDKAYAETFLTSGQQVNNPDENISKTQAAELFLANPYVAMTVNFNKKVDREAVEKQIVKAYQNSTPNEFEAAVKEALMIGLEGEERTMVGYHKGNIDNFGRISFIDMQLVRDPRKPYDTRHRLVDPRSINYIILRDTKYIVK